MPSIFRTITWNCQGAFRKKASVLLTSAIPDILVVSECEDIEHLRFSENNTPLPTTSLWFGENPHKGLGIFSYTGMDISVADCYDADIRFCVPLIVQAERKLHLLAVWATTGPEFSYIYQALKASRVYQRFLEERETLVMGDFNANRQWDHLPDKTPFMDTVENLNRNGLVSVYHTLKKEAFGEESCPTFYLARNIKRPFHIDYVFAPSTWRRNILTFEVGKYSDWRSFSDHCPLFVEFTNL